jgi:capsular polysaccharide biosynthesis protein
MFLKSVSNIVEVVRRTIAAAVIAMVVAMTIALRTRTMLLTMIIVTATTLIVIIRMSQRADADHQDAQPGEQTVRQFHGCYSWIIQSDKKGPGQRS